MLRQIMLDRNKSVLDLWSIQSRVFLVAHVESHIL